MRLSELTIRREAGFFSVPLPEGMGVRAAWTTREHDMGFEARRRRSALRHLKIDAKRLVCPSQVHGDKVVAVGKKERGRGAEGRQSALRDTDALITQTPGTILSVLTADCLSVFLAASGKRTCLAGRQAYRIGRRAAGLIHAGWRGLRAQIVAKTVRRMTKEYGLPAHALTVVLGPGIRPCCYEVSDDFLGSFPGSAYVRNGRVVLDLAAEAALQLAAAGVPRNRIFDSKLCTCCSGHLFTSYRRDAQEAGRSLSTLEILEPSSRGAARALSLPKKSVNII